MLTNAFAEITRDRMQALGLNQSRIGDLLTDWPTAKVRVLCAGTLRAGEVTLPEAVSLGDALGMTLDELAEAAGFHAPGGTPHD